MNMIRNALWGIMPIVVTMMLALPGQAAPYAEMVIDARTGEVIRARNADARLHPASLTKMMTLYIAFEAVRRGEITLDTEVRISRNAANEPPSKLGLRAGQKIAFRYLIRAAAVKSANDAATAIGEAISGSEDAFSERMNRTALALGMTNTTFRNANGLTQSGHLSTARDMTTLGRRLFYDYPEYYNLFSRTTTDAGITQVRNTNRRLLNDYEGADGIKTGYTSAAGYNLTSSAQRGQERIIATFLGGTSVNQRNQEMARLLDLGFNRAPSRAANVQLAALHLPAPGQSETVIATRANPAERPNRQEALVRTASRPAHRTAPTLRVAENTIPAAAIEAEQNAISAALVAADAAMNVAAIEAASRVEMGDGGDDDIVIAARRPERRPPLDTGVVANVPAETASAELVAQAEQPRSEQARVVVASAAIGSWSVQLGAFSTRDKAERHLIQTALAQMESLNGATRDISSTIVNGRTMFRARFIGMSGDAANRACARLVALTQECLVIAPQI